MRFSQRIGVACFFLCLRVFALMLASPTPASAQTDAKKVRFPPMGGQELLRPVRLTAKEGSRFIDALNALAKQAPVAFVAEGVPLRAVLPESEAPHFEKAAPLFEVVAKVAEAYDYDTDCQVNVFTFKKRYSDERDLPGVTVEECASALRQILSLAAPHNPNIDFGRKSMGGPLVGDLLKTLTPEQMKQMQDRRLMVNSLRPEQVALVRRTALFFAVQQPMMDVQSVLRVLTQANEVTVRFDDKGRFGYDCPSSDGVVRFTPFAHMGSAGFPPAISPAGDAPPAEVARPLIANVAAQEAEQGKVIAGVVAKLNAWSNNTGKRTDDAGDLTRVAVDDTLGQKPVIVVGQDASTPSRILKAMQRVYRLDVRLLSSPPKLLLAPKKVIPMQQVTALAYMVNEVVPEPLLRAIHDAPPIELPMPEKKLPDDTPQEELLRLMNERQIKIIEMQHAENMRRRAPTTLRKEAARVLQAAFENAQRKDASIHSLRYSELNDYEKRAFTVAVMAQFLQSMQTFNLNKIMPEYVARFDELALGGGIVKQPGGKDTMELWLLIPRPNGRMEELAGTGGTPYNP